MDRRAGAILCMYLDIILSTCIIDPGLPEKRYVRLGDINLGGTFPASTYHKEKLCGSELRGAYILQFIEAMVFAIDRINARSDILPNTTIGFAILDDCFKEATAVSQGLSFIPRVKPSASCESQQALLPAYDVIGVVGSMESSTSMALARLLGSMKVPQISYVSTSDELSNKEFYPYFMRVVPPDRFQVLAIMSFIKYHKWTYISVIYLEGSYGELAYQNIKVFSEKNGICIAHASKIPLGAIDSDYDTMINSLLVNEKARVVIVFSGQVYTLKLMEAVQRKNAEKKFIWIGSESWGINDVNSKKHLKTALGAFTTKMATYTYKDFGDYFRLLTPISNTENPWFHEFWEKQFSCKMKTYNDSCGNRTLSESNSLKLLLYPNKVIDAVMVLALGTQRVIDELCPGLTGPNVSGCVNGEALLKAIQNNTFQLDSHTITFDVNGDVLDNYILQQLVAEGDTFTQINAATWEAASGSILVNHDPVTWKYNNLYNSTEVPESACSKPCGQGEYFLQQEMPCCWECRKCRENEIVKLDRTGCLTCPKYAWPDTSSNYTVCSAIQHVSVSVHDPIPALLLGLAILGICAALVVLVFYTRHHNNSHIKAASRELSFLMLLGIIVGYIAAAVGLVSKLTDDVCLFNYIGFCLGFSLIYAPLVTRTNRIYRIFETGKRSTTRPAFISPISQIIIVSIMTLGQIGLCIITIVVFVPTVRLFMPVRTEKYVEKYCDITLGGLSTFLAYNLVLVILCSYFAFKTRKLPDNFNESRFISMCVYTTLVIWLAFIPTYFTTSREYYKTILLCTALILNDTVFLIFLYLPKVYAVLYVKNIPGTKVTQPSMFTTNLGRTLGNSVQVAPQSPAT